MYAALTQVPRPLPEIRDPGTGRIHAGRLAEALGVRQAQLARALGVRRQLLSENPTSERIQARAARLELLLLEVAAMVGDLAQARMWLHTPTPIWGEKSTWQVIEEGGLEDALAFVLSLKEGLPS